MVREFYSHLPGPVRVGIEATGSMQWFVNRIEELGIECLVGHPAEIRAAEPRKQKHDRRDVDLLLSLLVEERFPTIWLPRKELLDIRALLRHRHQWVGLRVKIQNALQAIALANGLRREPSLWTEAGQQAIAALPLSPHAAHRRNELQATLIIGLMSARRAILVSDRRLSISGKLFDDEKNKATVLFCADGRVAVAFTGLAIAGRFEHLGYYYGFWQRRATPTICSCQPMYQPSVVVSTPNASLTSQGGSIEQLDAGAKRPLVVPKMGRNQRCPASPG